jgi:hypothetical protein
LRWRGTLRVLDPVEAAVHPDGAAPGLVAYETIQVLAKGSKVHRRRKGSADVRLKGRHDGERRPRPLIHRVSPPIRLYLVEAAVEGDHLSVQRV